MHRSVAFAILVALVGCRGDHTARIDPPVVAIVVSEPELGIDTIEHAVTEPLEQALASMSSVRSIRSESRAGVSTVVAELADETGYADARSRIEAIRARLPENAFPELRRVAPDAPDDLVLAVAGTRTPVELTRIAHDWIIPRVERLPGVGEVRVRGGQEHRFEVRVDPARLDAMGVTVLEVAEALAENIDVPAGQLETGATVRVIDRPSEVPEQLRMRVVGQRDGAPIRIGDVATMQEVPVPPHAEPLELGIRFMRGTDRTRLASQIVQVIRADVPSGVSITTTPPVARAPRVTLIGDDRTTLAHAADEVARSLGIEVPHEPTVEMTIDRERATAFGISAAELSRAIAVALGQPVARTSDGTDVVLRAPELERLHVRGAQGALVQLTDLVTRRTRDGEVVRLRIDRRPAIELTVPGRSVADVRKRVAAISVPGPIRVQIR